MIIRKKKKLCEMAFFLSHAAIRTWIWIVDDNLTFQAVLLLLRLRKTSIHKWKTQEKKWLLRHDAFTSFFASQSWYTQPSSLVSAKSSAELHHLMMMLPKPHITRAAYTTSGLVTNSILFCRLKTIYDQCKQVRFLRIKVCASCWPWKPLWL